ncbi:YhbD family protein [Paenibacillus sp. SM 69]|nr:YhbD family protein [Paenibacillus oleatilyticus]
MLCYTYFRKEALKVTERELISKKDLLELTGISYGQLYRWKRKNLIPEEWFIRKSTFTGQETFFPKESILARIDKIVNMKDDLSLDELADVFSPNLSEVALGRAELEKRNIVTKETLDFYIDQQGTNAVYDFENIICMYALDKLLQTGEMTLEEGKGLIQTMAEHYSKLQGKTAELIFFRKMGMSGFVIATSPGEVYFEPRVRVVARISIGQCAEELKIKLS